MVRSGHLSSGRRIVTGRAAFTLVELLVVIGIIAVLISILIPALNKAREQSIRVKCASNLHQIGTAAMAYVAENKGWLPRMETNNPFYVTNRTGSGRWYDARGGWQKYIKDPNCFYCPGFSTDTFLDRKVVASSPDDRTQQLNSKDAQVGWSAIPIDKPQDLYVSIQYGIFCGWVRAKGQEVNPDNPLRLLLNPDEPIPTSDPKLSDCPALPEKMGAKRSSEIPYAADATLREPSEAPQLSAGSMLYQANRYTPTWWASHRRRGRFDGLNTLFLDGHVVWRTAAQAGPRLTWDGGGGTKYGYLYWY